MFTFWEFYHICQFPWLFRLHGVLHAMLQLQISLSRIHRYKEKMFVIQVNTSFRYVFKWNKVNILLNKQISSVSYFVIEGNLSTTVMWKLVYMVRNRLLFHFLSSFFLRCVLCAFPRYRSSQTRPFNKDAQVASTPRY